ncbi:peroxidase skpo-1 [Galendromus occidentalis]|uniref:Peroxidase skpo-1 n=1 Tax=Galendromus occidentalis TaxID=34638 RepID=A0AAJ6QS47_9ACAR|nr:peroxidase skpo-1 [Galendromus occidentalis]
MSKAEMLHLKTSTLFNDSMDRSHYENSREKRDLFYSSIGSYLKHCVKPVLQCGTDGYRSYSGICNNVRNHKWGAVHSCLLRLLPANYEDGVAKPVKLAPPSTISAKLRHLGRAGNSTNSVTNFFFAFGQFLAHDITNSVTSDIIGSDCCESSGESQDQCEMRLDVSSDPFFKRHNVTCINFIRGARCPCKSGPRDQMNGATSFIDLSQVYGNDGLLSDYLKDTEEPYLLKTERGDELPLGGKDCVSTLCFFGGDHRINQQAALTAMHTLFLRNHNFLARKLRELNPTWSAFKVFEEARKISIAQFQVVFLKEFLPLLLGFELLDRHGMCFETFLRRASVYDDNLEPGMFNEFVTAAFRLHTMIPERLGRLPYKFFDVDEYLREDGRPGDHCSSVLQNLIHSRGKTPEFPASNVVSRHIYDTDGDFGLDLVAINIQRGRDHGLRPYVDYLAAMRNISVTKFDDLIPLMGDEAPLILQSAYADVADVDLFVGGHLEKKQHGLLGSLVAEICVTQFKRIIEADRFFVTHRNFFYKEQFEALMRSTSADILCTNTELKEVPTNAFKMGSEAVICSERSGLNLELWRDHYTQI